MENVVLKKCKYACIGLNRYSGRLFSKAMLKSTQTLRIMMLIGLFCLSAFAQVSAQQVTVRGKVVDDKGVTLPGVSIKLKGATSGTVSDAQGTYSISVPRNATLIFSFIGFVTQEADVNNRTTIDISLVPSAESLEEVVVTALGIVKEKKALGYSVTELKGESITQAREVNVGNAFEGKVAGVNVNSVSGGAGASVNIQIRGMSSISQSNQPLYVINGVPMTNETSTGTGTGSQVDRGDNIGNINPDDIETISVLKGAAASALYGSRAKAGVILITTKSGKAGDPGTLEFSTNYVVDQVMDQTHFQMEYGQGQTGVLAGVPTFTRPTSASGAVGTGLLSYGPKVDGVPTVQADGVLRPYVATKNAISDFYQTGGTLTNTLAFTKGFEGGSVRVSGTNLNNNGVTPYSGLKRQSFNVSVNYNIIKRLNLDVRANYILEQGINRPKISDITANVHNAILLYANTINLNDFKDVVTTSTGAEFPINGNVFVANPWFTMKNYENRTGRNRLISSATLRYNFDNGIFIQGRAARDFYTDRYREVTPTGSAYSLTGALSESSSTFNEINVDGLAGKEFKVTKDITITPNLGSSLRLVNTESISSSGTGFSVPYVYYLGNVPSRTVSYGLSKQESQSVYGTVEFNYKDMVYLTGTGRNDWYSTLASPDGSNTVNQFYPSISGSFVYSELLKNYKWLSFGKLRVGYAQVGQATGPYQTSLSYGIGALPLGTSTLGSISGSTVPNKALQPSLSTELEIGTDVRFFNNRLSFDLTWYKKQSTNEIVNAPTSVTSGFTAAALNLGKIQNTGFEAMVSGIPVKTANGFTWTTSVNGTINNNIILALAPGTSTLVWATARRGPAFIQYIVGKPAAQVVAVDYARNTDGSIQINPSSGLALPGSLIPMGSAYAKYIAGWTNEISYKKFNLSFLIDGKWGAKIYSNTESESYTSGKNAATTVGREKIWGNNLSAMDYYQNLVKISSNFVEDASFIKFRQIIAGYTFPTNMFKNKIKSLNISFVCRNVFTIMKHTNNIDPEAAYTGGAKGLDMGDLPPQRSSGINLVAKF